MPSRYVLLSRAIAIDLCGLPKITDFVVITLRFCTCISVILYDIKCVALLI